MRAARSIRTILCDIVLIDSTKISTISDEGESQQILINNNYDKNLAHQMGLEPTTSALGGLRAIHCATGANLFYLNLGLFLEILLFSAILYKVN